MTGADWINLGSTFLAAFLGWLGGWCTTKHYAEEAEDQLREIRRQTEDAFYRVFRGLEGAINEAIGRGSGRRFEWTWTDEWSPDQQREDRWVKGARWVEPLEDRAKPGAELDSEVDQTDDDRDGG